MPLSMKVNSQASRSGHFTLTKTGEHKAGLDMVVKRKLTFPAGKQTLVIQPMPWTLLTKLSR
jgi:hypothetical protein